MSELIQWWGYRHINGSIITKVFCHSKDILEAKSLPWVDETHGPFSAVNLEEARNVIFRALKSADDNNETINPDWLKASMTIEQATKAASMRNCTLRASFDRLMGVRIVAVRKPQ